MNEKKFLDYEGLRILWSKISMKDYPNNEVLAAVINAIDETKVDKEDGKGLSTNDFTTTYKEKLDNLEDNIEGQINEHNASEESHSDIREQVAGAAYIDASDNENVEDSTIDDYVNRQIDTHNNDVEAHGDIREQIGSLSSEIADKLPLSGGTMTGELRVNGGDKAGGSKIVLETGTGQITNSDTSTLFGYTDTARISVGHSSAVLAMRGSAARPQYNGNDLALKSDISTVTQETWTFTLEDGSTVTKNIYIG